MSGADPWRRRCPEGHCSWRPNSKGYYCRECQTNYDQLVDQKTGKLVTDGGTVNNAGGKSAIDTATNQESPGAAGQADPGQEQEYARNCNNDSSSHNVNDRSTEPSPSCGWRGVCYELGVDPGR